MSDRNSGNSREEHEQERVVVRDRRRIDPVTGEVRTPAGEQPAGGAPGSAPEGATTDARVAELAAQVEERTADLQRVSAEYANYRRRVDRDREVVLASARAQFVGEMFAVLDDLDRAEAHGDLTGPFKSVADKIVAVVGKLGLETYGDAGELFDPALHEAVQHEESAVTGPSTPVVTVVTTVLRKGYRMADRVLRPAMVVVADRPAEPEPDTPDPSPPTNPGTT